VQRHHDFPDIKDLGGSRNKMSKCAIAYTTQIEDKIIRNQRASMNSARAISNTAPESQLIRLYPQRAASFDYTLRQDVHLADIDIT
jgi:hypothetical protein